MAGPLDLYEPEPINPGLLRGYTPTVEKPGLLGSLAKGFGRQTIPMGAGVVAAPIGEAIGGGLGALGGPIAPLTVPLGTLAGGLIAGGVAGYYADKAQRDISHDYLDDFGFQSEAADVAAHPTATFLGGLASQGLFMRPGGGLGWKGAALGAGIGAGVEGGTELVQGDFDPAKVLASGAAGALLQHPTRLGRAVQMPANGIVSGAARIGSRLQLEQALREVPNADAAVARAAVDAHDPNVPQDVRRDLARARVVGDTFGDRRTPDEIAAGHVAENDYHTLASNPFAQTAEGAATHADALSTAAAQLAADMPVRVVPPPPPRNAGYSGDAAVAGKIIGVESGGDPNAHNPRSSASGLGQFTDDTWLRTWKLSHGHDTGKSDAAILALKTDPTTSRAMTVSLTAQNRMMLAREQLPVTDGNLYLAHFLGPRAMRLLRADPATPVAELVSERAIASNPRILRGKTAGEVIAWAAHKMGGAAPDVAAPQEAWAGMAAARGEDLVPGFDDPALFERAENYGDPFGDEVAQLAPRPAPLRATVPQSAAADDGLGPSSILSFVPKIGDPGVSIINEEGHFATAVFRNNDGVAIGGARMPLTEEARAISNEVSIYVRPEARRQGIGNTLYDALQKAGHPVDELSGTGDLTPDGAAFVSSRRQNLAERDKIEAEVPSPIQRTRRLGPPNRKGPIDVQTFLADRGGVRDDEGHRLGRGGRDMQRMFTPGSGPLLRKTGMSIDDAGELLHEAGYFVGDRPTTADVLDMLDRAAFSKVYRPDEAAEMWASRAAAEDHGFDEAGGDGAHAQADSLTHDLEMAAVADPALAVALDDAAAPRRVADVLKALNEDDGAIAALKACATPGGTT